MNARKLAALMAKPPSLPGRTKQQATPGNPKRDQLTALFGDSLSDLENEVSPVSAPQTHDNAITMAQEKTAATSPPTTAEKTKTVATSNKNMRQQKEQRIGVTTDDQLATAALPTLTSVAAPTTATTDSVNPPPRTPEGTTTANKAILRPDRPPISAQVHDDLTVHVPYNAATVSRVYKVRLATRRFTLRFGRDGRSHYMREFPA